MPHHDVKLTVVVLDTVTGERATDATHSTWDWTEGNWSCDCNRRGLFDVEEREDCVSERFLVVSAEPILDGWTLGEFNEDYPVELLHRHGLPVSPLVLARLGKDGVE